MANAEFIVTLMIKVAAAFPHSHLSPETYEVYAAAFEDVPDDVLSAAFTKAAQMSEFFPTLKSVRTAIAEILVGGIPTAEEAWEQVSFWVKSEHTLTEPLIIRVVEMMGGWRYFSTTQDIGVARGQFLKMYNNLRLRHIETVSEPASFKQLQTTYNEARQIKTTEPLRLTENVAQEVTDADDMVIPVEEGLEILRRELEKRQGGKQWNNERSGSVVDATQIFRSLLKEDSGFSPSTDCPNPTSDATEH